MKQVLPLLVLFITQLYGQSGAWRPENADLSYPRTIIDQTETASLRESIINNPVYSELYRDIYSSAVSSIPPVTEANRFKTSKIIKNAAFVYFTGLKAEAGIITGMTETEKASLLQKILPVAGSFSVNVDRITLSNAGAYNSWQWRSKELINYAIAYDLLRGAGVDSEILEAASANIRAFAGNLYEESARAILPPFFNSSFYDLVKNNHAIMTASALGVAAIVFSGQSNEDSNEQPLNWINAAIWHTDNVFFRDPERQSEPGKLAGFAEGPGYLRYSMANALPFFHALANFLPDGNYAFAVKGETRSIRHPFYDPNYDLLYEWAGRITIPDGRMTPIEDTHVYASFPELAIAEKPEYLYEPDYSAFNITASLSRQLVYNNDLRADYIASGTEPAGKKYENFQVLPESGDVIFQSNDPSGIYMRVNARHGLTRTSAMGHNQSDAASFMLYSYGEMMALDPGYISYARRNEVSSAANHNMILVDDEGPLAGTPFNANGADAVVKETFSAGNINIATVTTAYNGAEIERSFFFIDNSWFLISDKAVSDSEKKFTFQMHGAGKENGNIDGEGIFIPDFDNGAGIWRKNESGLYAKTLALGGPDLYSSANSYHEFYYDSAETHSVMLTDKYGSEATFLSVLYPFTGGEPGVQTLANGEFTALRVGGSYVFQAADTAVTITSGILPSMEAKGELVYLSLGAVKKFLAVNAKSLSIDGKNLLNINGTNTIYFEINEDGNITGRVKNAGEIEVYTGGIATVRGTGVISYENMEDGITKITFAENATFDISVENNVLSSVIAGAAGWNLVSIPLTPENASVNGLFGNAVSQVYRFNGAYSPVYELTAGEAYWVKFSENKSFAFSGKKPVHPVTLKEGWNLVGVFNDTVDISNLASAPEGIITSPFYGYENGYVDQGKLIPGKGYWVKASGQGVLLFENIKGLKKSNSRAPVLEKGFTITNNIGYTKTLFLDDNRLDLSYFEAPPTPPPGTPDARFEGNRYAASIHGTNTVELSGGGTFSITAEDLGLEITLSEGPVKLSPGETIKIPEGIKRVSVRAVTIPAEFALSQNYPNPFNPSTTISFLLSVESNVKILLYNLLGEEVASITEEKYEAGWHNIKFNAGELPSGVYLYRMEAGNFIQTRKMILIK